ncbi:hypothetical protein JZ751_016380 [Albula glossodonta]|uniref:Uncharacterized protein n=1 Tax=Albula glossodonta TaxID=121402 RepID=A0A8T2NPU0_9TELE|nr:hypothetical protein JZ751_016380 [Albula glossodonta]
MEISRSQEENEALKCKIQTMELQSARESAEKSGAREQPAQCLCGGVQIEESQFKTTESLFMKQTDRSLDGEPTVAPEGSPAEPTDMKDEWRPGGGERPPIQEVQNKAANHTEELSEQQRTRHGVWEPADGEQQTLIKEERAEEVLETGDPHTELRSSEERFEESSSDSVGQDPSVGRQTRCQVWGVGGLEAALKEEQRRHCRESEGRVAGLDSLGSCLIARKVPSSLLPQWNSSAESEDTSGSYSTQMPPENPSCHSVPVTVEVPLRGCEDGLGACQRRGWNVFILE